MASDMQHKREKEAGQMIKTRLIKLLSHSKKYIFYTVLWQWIALLTQITAVFTIAQVIGKLVEKTLKTADVRSAALIFIIVLIVRFISDRMVSHSSFMACADVKRILREKIYEKMLRDRKSVV